MVRQMVQSEKSTGFVPASSPTYDVAGNPTYDGLQCYTYDAWNRLATMAHGYRDATGVHSGGVLSTCGYDGRGRRISKAITGTGSLDCTYQYYYDQDSLTETRNGSDIAIKQQVWGRQYVDELVQVAVNSDQSGDNSCDAMYWVCQDANYNVLGLVDNQGVLAERYEYTPYGQRTVFFSPGVNDVACYASTLTSRKIVVGGVAQPYGLCEFGHQGLQHDEESGLIYNRARMLQPVLERFMQRDPLGYVDGMSLCQYQQSRPVLNLDASGQFVIGFGVGGSITFQLPVAGAWGLGLSGSGATMIYTGRDKGGMFCEVCDSVGLTVMLGIGAAVNISAGPVGAVGWGDRPTSGSSVQIGVGVGIPTNPTATTGIEIIVDLDIPGKMLTVTWPKLSVGVTAYATLRVTGNCNGCTNGVLSFVSGKSERQAKVMACVKPAQVAFTQALSALNGRVVSDGAGGTLKIPVAVESDPLHK